MTMPELYLWMICIGLALVVLSVCWQLVKAADTERPTCDPIPRLAARDRSEQVRKAMTPDEVPMPSTHGTEEIDIDTLWARRN